MTYEDYRASLRDEEPPAVSAALRALWYDGHGDWNRAHDTIQDEGGPEAAWVHAYLHRKEGDHGNARYWYARAGHTYTDVPLREEWEQIVSSLLDARDAR